MKKHKDSFTYGCHMCGRRFKALVSEEPYADAHGQVRAKSGLQPGLGGRRHPGWCRGRRPRASPRRTRPAWSAAFCFQIKKASSTTRKMHQSCFRAGPADRAPQERMPSPRAGLHPVPEPETRVPCRGRPRSGQVDTSAGPVHHLPGLAAGHQGQGGHAER